MKKKNEINSLLDKLKVIEDQLINLHKTNEDLIKDYNNLNKKVIQLEENEKNINELFKFCCCI